MSVVLKTGDPSSGPASFTRFVLPFRYALQPVPVSSRTTVAYRRATLPNLPWRRKYYTPETATALFTLTNWYELQDPTRKRVPAFEVTLHPGRCDGAMLALKAFLQPSIVLFESDRRGASNGADDGVLNTGFLLVDMSFAAGETLFLEDLLFINERFRYWRKPFDHHELASSEYSRGESRCIAAYSDLVSGLRSTLGRPYDDIYFDRWSEFLSEYPLSDDAGTFRLFPAQWDRKARDWTRDAEGSAGWIASTDERAFVWTCALTDGGALALNPECAWRTGEWVRLLNVDKPSGDDATAFEQEWVEPRTYKRWQHWGTLYGFNGHAGAMLASSIRNPPLWEHFRELYFDQMLLLLYLRTTIFRLSHRLSECYISVGNHPMEKIEPFRDLRDRFARFANLYQFPLLSNQQQGVEMYALARKALDIDDLFGEIREQVETTHEYLELRLHALTSSRISFLTFLGTVGVVMTLMLTADTIREPLLKWLAFTRHPRFALDAGALVFSAGIGVFVRQLLQRIGILRWFQ